MRYHLRPLQDSPGWWVLEDADTGMHIRFRECDFNGTQEATFADPDIIGRLGASGVAKVLQEAGRWLYLHAYNIAMPDEPKFMLQLGAQDERVMLIRTRRQTLPEIRESHAVSRKQDVSRNRLRPTKGRAVRHSDRTTYTGMSAHCPLPPSSRHSAFVRKNKPDNRKNDAKAPLFTPLQRDFSRFAARNFRLC